MPYRPHFSLDLKTRSAEGLLFYIPAEQDHQHLALYVSRGRIRFSVGKETEIFNREKYNDGKWHTVSVDSIVYDFFLSFIYFEYLSVYLNSELLCIVDTIRKS